MAAKKKIAKWLFSIFCIPFVVLGVINLILWSFTAKWEPPYKGKNAHIVLAIRQARTVMTYIGSNDGNYDNFNCEHEEMVALCQEIDKNYGKEDGKEPIIAHDAPSNSQAVCIYSPLNRKERWLRKKIYWYCADNGGHVGYTSTDPGSNGYCVDGKGAVCPPVLEYIP